MIYGALGVHEVAAGPLNLYFILSRCLIIKGELSEQINDKVVLEKN